MKKNTLFFHTEGFQNAVGWGGLAVTAVYITNMFGIPVFFGIFPVGF